MASAADADLPPRSQGRKEPQEKSSVLNEQPTQVCRYLCPQYVHIPGERMEDIKGWPVVQGEVSAVKSAYRTPVAGSLVLGKAERRPALYGSPEVRPSSGSTVPCPGRVLQVFTMPSGLQQGPAPQMMRGMPRLLRSALPGATHRNPCSEIPP